MGTSSDITQIGSSTAAGCAAGGPAGCAAGAIKGAISSLVSELAQHTARLKDATNENAALDKLIPAFDADLAEIATAYNNGTASESDCIQALQNVDANVLKNLKANVGKVGTAWGGPSLGSALSPNYNAPCNKSCTAGCCVYLNDLRPAIYGRSQLGTSYAPWQNSPGRVLGMIEVIQSGGGTVNVITVAAPPNKAYGNYQRTGYSLKLTAPQIVQSVQGTLEQTIASLTGQPSGSPLSNLGVTSSPLTRVTALASNPLYLIAGIGLAILLGLALVRK